MTTLPSALAPWRAELELFAPELVDALGTMIQRLAPLVGPPVHDTRDPGEPEGLGDLARRGSYERLLASEWLLAEEMPDEFIRRAASSEHLFLAPEQRRAGSVDPCTVLFDVGPLQLGAPRVAHLALLLLLARRAEHARLPFRFGALQHPERPLATTLTHETIRGLLGARSHALPDVARWSELGPGEVWIVGAPEHVPDVWARSVVVDEVLDPSRRALCVRARQGSRPPVERTIDLPPEDVAVRLLRNPFPGESARPAPQRTGRAKPVLARGTPLRISSDGRRVFVRVADGRLAALHVEPTGTPGKPRLLPPVPNATLVAATYESRWRSIWMRNDRLVATGWSKGDAVVDLGLAEGVTPPRFVEPGRVWMEHGVALRFVDGHESLFSIGYPPKRETPDALPERLGRVLTDRPSSSGTAALVRTATGQTVWYGGGPRPIVAAQAAQPGDLLIESLSDGAHMIAVRVPTGWFAAARTVQLQDGLEPLSFSVNRGPDPTVDFVCFDAQRTRILYVRAGVEPRVLIDANERILKADVAESAPLVAALTQSGRLLVATWYSGGTTYEDRFELAS